MEEIKMASEEEVEESSSPSSLLFPYTTKSKEEEERAEEEEDIIFCSEENITEASVYINQELEVLGFNSILSSDQQEPSLVKLLNTTYDLLQHYRGSLQRRDSISMSLQRTRSDLTLQSEATNRLKAELQESERKLIQHKEKERQVITRNRSLSLQLKAQEEECTRLRHRLSQKELQYEHELRKKEREYHRLNERLGQLVLDKSQEKKLGIKMLNTLQQHQLRGGGKTRDGSNKEEKVYKLVISHYEEKQKELMLENSSLRDSLCNMEKELVTLLNQQYLNSLLSSPATNNTSSTNKVREERSFLGGDEEMIDSGHYQMPFDIVRQDIEENLRDKYKKLREYILSLKEEGHTHSPQYDKDIEELEKKLADYRDIISQQEILLEKQLEESISGPGLGFLNESRYLKREEMLELKEEKNKQREEYLKREEERLNLLAKQIDRERHNFEDKKTQFLTQQLDSSIFTTPSKPSSAELDSFFLSLSSTPFTVSRDRFRPHPSTHKPRPFTPAVYKTIHPSVQSKVKLPESATVDISSPPLSLDFKQNISLTSDDGLEVLNE